MLLNESKTRSVCGIFLYVNKPLRDICVKMINQKNSKT